MLKGVSKSQSSIMLGRSYQGQFFAIQRVFDTTRFEGALPVVLLGDGWWHFPRLVVSDVKGCSPGLGLYVKDYCPKSVLTFPKTECDCM